MIETDVLIGVMAGAFSAIVIVNIVVRVNKVEDDE